MSEPTPKSPRASLTESTEIVLPQHTNAIGTAFGGTIMSWINICAAVSAQRHCGRVAVTASVDALEFTAPIRLGDVVILHARINAVFRTSMEVACSVHREITETGERILCAEALLTFVNIGPDGRPAGIVPLAVETEDDAARAKAAVERRAFRLAQKHR